jgi:hypothetical protein
MRDSVCCANADAGSPSAATAMMNAANLNERFMNFPLVETTEE